MSVIINTTFGPLKVRLFWREAPKACRNFIELCKEGYYDGCIFFRVIPDVLVQTGDPRGDGTGGESIYGPKFEDEISGKLSHDRPGIVSMASIGRNTNASQFFITMKPLPHMDGKYTIFGEVVDGWETLEQFKLVRTKSNRPVKPIKVFSTQVVENPWEGEQLPEGCELPEKVLMSGSPTPSNCLVS